jgi:AcrR family transcriptional regulator
MAEGQSLRERKKQRTRADIIQAAVAAMIERGYDATTLEDIARAVDVHKRTVHRYFPSKLHIVLHTQYAAVERFRKALAAPPADVGVVRLWRLHLRESGNDMIGRRERMNVERIARREPAVHTARLVLQEEYAQLLAAALSAEEGLDPENDIVAMLAAGALTGGVFLISRKLQSRDAYDDLYRATRKAIDLVEATLLKGRNGC